MSIVVHVLGKSCQSNYPQNRVANCLPVETPVSEDVSSNVDEREEEEKQKVIHRISHAKKANQLLFLFSFMRMRLEA